MLQFTQCSFKASQHRLHQGLRQERAGLKQKTLVGKLWAIIVLAVAAIFIGVVFGPGIAKMIAGPTHFAPQDDHDVLSLQGQYLEADIDTLIDYYAETVVSESGRPDKVSAREYIMPVNTPDATVYIGVEVPKPKISDAEAVVADTERLIDDEDPCACPQGRTR